MNAPRGKTSISVSPKFPEGMIQIPAITLIAEANAITRMTTRCALVRSIIRPTKRVPIMPQITKTAPIKEI